MHERNDKNHEQRVVAPLNDKNMIREIICVCIAIKHIEEKTPPIEWYDPGVLLSGFGVSLSRLQGRPSLWYLWF